MLDSYRDLIDGLLETPGSLRGLLGDPPPANVSPRVHQLLTELRVREAVALRRAQKIMRGERVILRAIEQEPEIVAATNGVAPEQTVEELVTGFNADRGDLVSLLMNVTIREWERPIEHNDRGETTLAEEIDDHLTWDEDVIARIRDAE